MSTNTVFTNTIAENYEKYMGPIFFVPYAKDMADRLSSGKINSLLELACGTGQVTRLLRARFPDARIVATDLSPGMLEFAKKIVNPADKIEWLIADAQELPFGENTFDAVICQFGLMFVPDKQKAVKEAYRVLKQGGIFILSTWDRIENNPIFQLAKDAVSSYFKDGPPDYYSLPFSMYDPAEIESLFRTSGFEHVSVENVHCSGYSPLVEHAAKALTEGQPVYHSICELDEKFLPQIQRAVSNAISNEFGSTSLKIPHSAWVAEGMK